MHRLPRTASLLASAGLLFTCLLHGQTAHYAGTQIYVPYMPGYQAQISFDQAGNLYGIDVDNGIAYELTADGQSVTLLSGLNDPNGITADSQGNLYISEISGPSGPDVIKATPTKTASGTTYTRSVLPITGLDFPGQIAVDAKGKIYITANTGVVVETPTGNSYVQSALPLSGTVYPRSIALDNQGAVYIGDEATHKVFKETPSGNSYVESYVGGRLTSTIHSASGSTAKAMCMSAPGQETSTPPRILKS